MLSLTTFPARRLLHDYLIHLLREHFQPISEQVILNRQLAHLVGLFDFLLTLGLIFLLVFIIRKISEEASEKEKRLVMIVVI